MTNTANKPLDWYMERTTPLGIHVEERRQVLQRALDSRTRYMTISPNTYHAQNASALVRHCRNLRRAGYTLS